LSSSYSSCIHLLRSNPTNITFSYIQVIQTTKSARILFPNQETLTFGARGRNCQGDQELLDQADNLSRDRAEQIKHRFCGQKSRAFDELISDFPIDTSRLLLERKCEIIIDRPRLSANS